MKSVKGKKAMMQKQIPTLVGLVVLVIGLIAGLLFFGNGTGVFAPRATAQTTPKNIRVSNVTDKSFTISFYTDQATPGFVKYGDSAGSLKTQMSDDRDQLSGVVDPYKLHHITVRGLSPGTLYHYVLGTGSGSTFDNQGSPFTITTAKDTKSPPPASKTIYGSVSGQGGTPAEGSIVYVTTDGVSDMSSLVRSSGSWAVSLANARDSAGTAYADISDESPINIFVQGEGLALTTELATTVADAQPAADLTLGQSATAGTKTASTAQASGSASPSNSKAPIISKAPQATPSTTTDKKTPTASGSARGGLQDLVGATDDTKSKKITPTPKIEMVKESTLSATLDLEEVAEATAETKIVTQPKPKIQGKAKPNVIINISVHSEVEYEDQITADENGDFEFDMSEYSEGLEPGEHTVTYTYIDPETGEEIEKVHTFYVEDDTAGATTTSTDTTSDTEDAAAVGGTDTSNQIAQADTTETTYGSGNPYPITSPTPSSSTTSAVSTRSALVSTDSGVYKAGSVSTTMILVAGGLFFIFTGVWSWWLAGQVETVEVDETDHSV